MFIELMLLSEEGIFDHNRLFYFYYLALLFLT